MWLLIEGSLALIIFGIVHYLRAAAIQDVASVWNNNYTIHIRVHMYGIHTFHVMSNFRSRNIRESQQMSIQRKVEFNSMDQFKNSPRNSPASRRKTEPPMPPNKKKTEEPQVRMGTGSMFV